MARLLVTGASGFLGSVLAMRAAAAGWEVTGTFRSRPPEVSWRSVALDVRDGPAVARVIEDAAPDAVIHTAYRQDADDLAKVNVDGAAAVAAAARAAGARHVHISTDAVFRGGLGRPLRESDALDPVTPYGVTKAQAEQAVALANPAALQVRTSLIYGGPGCAVSKHEEAAIAAARGERQMTFFVNEVRSPVQVGDLASALVELLAADVTGPLHVAGADPVDRHAFAALIARSHGIGTERLVAGDSGPSRPGDCTLDSSRGRALLATPLRGVHQVLV